MIDEFMLKEYESIASAHFDSQAGLRQQFRFYLLIAAVPLTVLGLAFNRAGEDIGKIGLFNLPHVLSFVFLAIGVLGFLMLLSMVHTALDATLYARTVNGIRGYFTERGSAMGLDLQPYSKMPIDQRRPPYFHRRAFFWQVILTSLVNGFYVAVGVSGWYYNPCVSAFLVLVAASLQFLIYYNFCRQREQEEVALPRPR